MLKRHHIHWRYKNITFTILGIILVIFLSKNLAFSNMISSIGNLRFLGAIIGGALFVCTFTISFGALILFELAKSVSPLEIGIFAAIGAVFTDFVVFKFVKNNLTDEVKDLYEQVSGHHIRKMIHSGFFSWALPVLGAVIMASPLPDEIGISLMGISKMSHIQFILLSFVLNAIGIIIAVSLPRI
ncbi:MAG: hypothetical protein AAB656_02485 [Patescibacteria group bacterium]